MFSIREPLNIRPDWLTQKETIINEKLYKEIKEREDLEKKHKKLKKITQSS